MLLEMLVLAVLLTVPAVMMAPALAFSYARHRRKARRDQEYRNSELRLTVVRYDL